MNTEKLQTAMDQVDRDLANTAKLAGAPQQGQRFAPAASLASEPRNILAYLRQLDQRLMRLERLLGGES
jgi:hypothetical protein